MRALTIHQPYAGFIADGVKRYETRSWYTTYRGLLAIHASKNRKETKYTRIPPDRQFGAILAVGRLVACFRTEYLTEWCEDWIADEIDIGDFTPGRYAWKITDVERLVQPIPTRGYQGLWSFPPIATILGAGREVPDGLKAK